MTITFHKWSLFRMDRDYYTHISFLWPKIGRHIFAGPNMSLLEMKLKGD